MRRKSNTSIYLKSVENALAGKNDYCVYGIQTTGDTESDQMVRFCAKVYSYKKEDNTYEMTKSIDHLVKVDENLWQKAVADDDGNKPVAGISESKYRSSGTLQPEEFKPTFTSFLKELSPDTLFIANNLPSCNRYMAKVNASDIMLSKQAAAQCIDASEVIKEYLVSNSIAARSDIESVYKVINGKDAKPNELLGADKRLDVISELVMQHGNNKKILDKVQEEPKKEPEKKPKFTFTATKGDITGPSAEELTKMGKDKYASASAIDKINILKKHGVVDMSKVNDPDSSCAYSELRKVLTGKENIKGIIAVAVATTGMQHNSETGNVPISLSLLASGIGQNGMLQRPDASKDIIMCEIAPADDTTKQQTINASKDSSFNPYAYTGMDSAKYLAGESSSGNPLASFKDCVDGINSFLAEHSDYALLVVANGNDNKNISLLQEAFEQNGGKLNLSKVQKNHCINMVQFFKEYAAHCVENDEKNVLFDISKVSERFSLPNIAESSLLKPQGKDLPTITTFQKVKFVLGMTQNYVRNFAEKEPDAFRELNRKIRDAEQMANIASLQAKKAEQMRMAQGQTQQPQRPAMGGGSVQKPGQTPSGVSVPNGFRIQTDTPSSGNLPNGYSKAPSGTMPATRPGGISASASHSNTGAKTPNGYSPQSASASDDRFVTGSKRARENPELMRYSRRPEGSSSSILEVVEDLNRTVKRAIEDNSKQREETNKQLKEITDAVASLASAMIEIAQQNAAMQRQLQELQNGTVMQAPALSREELAEQKAEQEPLPKMEPDELNVPDFDGEEPDMEEPPEGYDEIPDSPIEEPDKEEKEPEKASAPIELPDFPDAGDEEPESSFRENTAKKKADGLTNP